MMVIIEEKEEADAERLNAALDSAIEVAFNHGAGEWVKENYPEHYKRLSAAEFEASLRQFVGH